MKFLGLNAICVGKSAILRAILPLCVMTATSLLWGGAVENDGGFIGIEFGAGLNKAEYEYSKFSQTMQNPPKNNSVSQWGYNYGFTLGYKHFKNEWLGFRYYGIFRALHNDLRVSVGRNIATMSYGVNADLLVNLYSSEAWQFGLFGGIFVGGVTYHSKYLQEYESVLTILGGKVKKTFVSSAINAGIRFNIVQRVRQESKKTCEPHPTKKAEVRGGSTINYRLCKVPVIEFGHAIELIAFVPLSKSILTTINEANGGAVTGGVRVISAPQFTFSNPYNFGIRYAFSW